MKTLKLKIKQFFCHHIWNPWRETRDINTLDVVSDSRVCRECFKREYR